MGLIGPVRGESGFQLGPNIFMSNSIQNSSEDSQGPVFSGEFRHKIEWKNRITIPSAWRFGEEVELFMIRRTLENCIAVMPR